MKKVYALLTPLGLLLLPRIASSQVKDYSSFTDDPARERQLIDAISRRYQQDQIGLFSKNKKQITELYKERYELIKSKFDQKEILTNQEVQSYLDKLVQEIIGHNKQLISSELRIQFSR